jgi:hypothetical protein
MNNKRIYYSCSTWLSYEICQHYYAQRHYAWCAPFFDADSVLSVPNSIPPSSNPRAIYWRLKRDVDARDLHSAKIADVRNGIVKGAAVKRFAGIINRSQYLEIKRIAKSAQLADFSPLMFVIPLEPVANRVRLVDVRERASLLSEEYIIRDLPRRLFDAIEL